MKVSYELSLNDYWFFYKYLHRNVLNALVKMLASTLILPSCVSLYGFYTQLDPLTTVKLAGASVIANLALSIIYHILRRKYILSNLSHFNYGLVGKHDLELYKDGLMEITIAKKCMYYWPGIYDIVQTKKYILIFTNVAEAVILPKSAFDSSEQALEFYKQAQNHLNSNNG